MKTTLLTTVVLFCGQGLAVAAVRDCGVDEVGRFLAQDVKDVLLYQGLQEMAATMAIDPSVLEHHMQVLELHAAEVAMGKAFSAPIAPRVVAAYTTARFGATRTSVESTLAKYRHRYATALDSPEGPEEILLDGVYQVFCDAADLPESTANNPGFRLFVTGHWSQAAITIKELADAVNASCTVVP